jgi:hypothetical protein
MYRDKECQSLKHFQEHMREELTQLRAELAAPDLAEPALATQDAHHG